MGRDWTRWRSERERRGARSPDSSHGKRADMSCVPGAPGEGEAGTTSEGWEINKAVTSLDPVSLYMATVGFSHMLITDKRLRTHIWFWLFTLLPVASVELFYSCSSLFSLPHLWIFSSFGPCVLLRTLSASIWILFLPFHFPFLFPIPVFILPVIFLATSCPLISHHCGNRTILLYFFPRNPSVPSWPFHALICFFRPLPSLSMHLQNHCFFSRVVIVTSCFAALAMS